MKPTHKILSIHFEKDYMIVDVDNQQLRIKIADVSTKLNHASDTVRNDFKISPSGYGIHWSQIDEDLSIDGLLRS